MKTENIKNHTKKFSFKKYRLRKLKAVHDTRQITQSRDWKILK
jgi:hypothetical protein